MAGGNLGNPSRGAAGEENREVYLWGACSRRRIIPAASASRVVGTANSIIGSWGDAAAISSSSRRRLARRATVVELEDRLREFGSSVVTLVWCSGYG